MLYILFYFYIFYALLCTFLDLRTKSVPLMLHLIALGPGLVRFSLRLQEELRMPAISAAVFPGAVGGLLLPLLPGLLALFLSRCSREALGYGDAFFLLLSGLYLTMKELLLLLLSGILLSFFISAGLLLFGRIRGRRMGQASFPWIPCTLPALIALCLSVP